jgi:hypothetical protein
MACPRKAIVKARMMTGSYILQIDKHNNNSIDPTCPLCKADDETIIHLITTCPLCKADDETIIHLILSCFSISLIRTLSFPIQPPNEVQSMTSFVIASLVLNISVHVCDVNFFKIVSLMILKCFSIGNEKSYCKGKNDDWIIYPSNRQTQVQQ